VEDPFTVDALLMCAFEFSWRMCRPVKQQPVPMLEASLLLLNLDTFTSNRYFQRLRAMRQPQMLMMDLSKSPVLVAKRNVLKSDDFFDRFRNILPDFLSLQTKRVPIPRARWKNLWVCEPPSIVALQQMLAKLVEQALWAMALQSNSAASAGLRAVTDKDRADSSAAADPVVLEPWMEDAKPSPRDVKKKKKSRQWGKMHSAPKLCLSVEASTSAEDEELGDTENLSVNCATNVLSEDLLGASMSREETSLVDESDVDLLTSNAMDGYNTSSVNCDLGLEVDGRGISTAEEDGLSSTLPSLVMEERVVSNDEDLDVTNSSSESCGTDQWSTCQVWKPQLMCYVWDQTAQISIDSRSPELDISECAPRPWRNSTSLLRRGQWVAPQGDPPHFVSKLSAVARKTFIDIDDCDSSTSSSAGSPRLSRSLSPSYLARPAHARSWPLSQPAGKLLRVP